MQQGASSIDFGFPGLKYVAESLNRPAQQALLAELRAAVAESPLFTPRMPGTGQPFSVRMTNLGEVGWVADRAGYRYQSTHPVTAAPWPAIPQVLFDVWRRVADFPEPPNVCLINFYNENARMGMHQDKDEGDVSAPVVSVSLGDDALYRLGNLTRGGKTHSFKLHSGDVLVLGGASRLRYHGIDRIYPGTSTLLKDGGRISLTLRRVKQ